MKLVELASATTKLIVLIACTFDGLYATHASLNFTSTNIYKDLQSRKKKGKNFGGSVPTTKTDVNNM